MANRYGDDVTIKAGSQNIKAILHMPQDPEGIVLLAHASSSARFSVYNGYFAKMLCEESIGAILLDLLCEAEVGNQQRALDISFLAERLLSAHSWVKNHPVYFDLPVGYWATGTGADAAIEAAACERDSVRAIVCQSGRPDLAIPQMKHLKAPTLFIVGESDHDLLDLNVRALEKLTCPRELFAVPGAGRAFQEPGTIEAVAERAAAWFRRYFNELLPLVGTQWAQEQGSRQDANLVPEI